ncbi:MAG TPA: AI-2E family transporter [Gemmatimonadales bacterium]|jgi:predicted PurR-regulated permease PerM
MAIFDTKHQRAAWLVAILGVIVVIALSPYASGLLGAPVLYVAVAGLHARLYQRIHVRWFASLAIIVLVLVGLVLPMVWLVTLLVGQAHGAATAVLASPLLDRIGGLHIGDYDIGPQIRQAGSEAVSFLAGSAFSLLGTAARVTINLLLTMFGLYYLLMDPESAWKGLRPFIPFSDENVALLGDRFRAVTNATIIGTGVSALIQGVLMWLAFTVFGLSNAVFWGAVVVLFSLLPVVGSGMIWGPAVVVLFSNGRVGAAVGMALWGILMGLGVDYLIRPYVSNRYAQIHPLITLVGAIAGVSYLGIIGLLIGPLALSYFFELLVMYQKEYLKRS